MSNVIEMCLTHVSETKQQDSASVQEEIARLDALRGQLLPMETEAFKRLGEEILVLQRKISDNDLGLPVLDPVVFTWRSGGRMFRKDVLLRYVPYPTLGVININGADGEMEIRGTWGGGRYSHTGPQCLPRETYEDVGVALCSIARARISSVRLRTSFTGMIPNETRERINKWKTTFPNDIYIVNEASWKLESPPRPLFGDPLVIGAKAGRYYLIDVFDPTTLESYIAKEFSA
jgi:hypothetical protein